MEPNAAGLLTLATPPASQAAGQSALTIFATIFNAVDGPLQGAIGPVVGNVANQTHTWVVAGLTLWMAIWCAAQLFPVGSGGAVFLTGMFRELIQGAIAIIAVQTYAEFVVPFATQTFPAELTALFTADGSPVTGASVAQNYDTIWNQTRDLATVVGDRIPDSLRPSVIMLMLSIPIFKLIGFVMTVWAFWIYLCTHIIQTVLVVIGVIFVGLAAFPTMRKYAWGWLSALLATFCTIALLALILGLMLAVVKTEAQTLAAMPEGTAIGDQIDGFLGVIGCLFLLACTITATPFMGLAIFGGVHNSMGSFSAGAGAVGGAVAGGARRVAGAFG